jgi:hypothetical protein
MKHQPRSPCLFLDLSYPANQLPYQRNRVFEILEIKDAARRMDVSVGNRDNPRKHTFSGHMDGSRIRAPKERDFVLPGYE